MSNLKFKEYKGLDLSRINEDISLDVGYKYSYLGKIDGIKVRSSDLSIGVRFAF